MMQLRKTLAGHEGAVYALEESPREGSFFSGSGDRIVAEWDLTSSAPPKALVNVGAIVYSLCFLREKNEMLIGTSSGSIHVVNLESRAEERNISFQKGPVFHIRTSSKLNRVFASTGQGHLSVWSADDFTLLYDLKLCNEKVRSISLSPDQSILAAGCGDGTVRIFDTLSMREFHRIEAHKLSAHCVCFHPEGRYLLSGGRDAHLKAWNLADFSLLTSIPAHNYAVYAISFAPGFRQFATASRDKTVKIWNADTVEFVQRLGQDNNSHLNSVNNVLWMKNNSIVSASDDRSIRIWSQD